MAENIFINISDVPGDATDVNHKNWIVIQDMSFELERAVDMRDLGSTQRDHAVTNFEKIEVTSQIGIASNKLMESVANGTVRPEIELHVCRPGERASDGLVAYSIWKFKHVIIDNYSISLSEYGAPEEIWSMAYTGVEHAYKVTDPKSGKLEEKNKFKWNLRTDTAD